MKLNIVCIPGDGIGPEIVAEAKKVLDQTAKVHGHQITYTDILMGASTFEEFIRIANGLSSIAQYDENTLDQLASLIEKLNEDKSVNAILLQSPIPSNLNINEAFTTISPEKDIDGFNTLNVGKLVLE